MAIHDEQPKGSADEFYRVVMIDPVRKTELKIQLCDSEGDEVSLKETIQQLTEFVADKLKAEDTNTTKHQVTPLMAQAVVRGLIKLAGEAHACVMLSNESVRYALVHMMTVGFYLLKWIQKKKVKIQTTEHPVTDEDIAMYTRCSRATDSLTQFAAAGGDPKQLVKEFISDGTLKKEDLTEMGVADWFSEGEDTKKDEVN
jgi:hypothetical protein